MGLRSVPLGFLNCQPEFLVAEGLEGYLPLHSNRSGLERGPGISQSDEKEMRGQHKDEFLITLPPCEPVRCSER